MCIYRSKLDVKAIIEPLYDYYLVFYITEWLNVSAKKWYALWLYHGYWDFSGISLWFELN